MMMLTGALSQVKAGEDKYAFSWWLYKGLEKLRDTLIHMFQHWEASAGTEIIDIIIS